MSEREIWALFNKQTTAAHCVANKREPDLYEIYLEMKWLHATLAMLGDEY